MINAQQWLNNTFPTPATRQKITHLVISGSREEWFVLEEDDDEVEITDTWKKFKVTLQGPLDLNDFTNLERLYLGGGLVTELKIDQCQKLEFLDVAGENSLTLLDISHNQELTTLKSWRHFKPIKSLREKFQTQAQVKTTALTSKLELVKHKLTHWTQLLTNHD